MTTWRDRLGRWMRRPAPREAEPSPELSPMVQRSIAWLASQPDAAKMMGVLAEPAPPPEPRAPRRREPEAPAHSFADLAEKAAALTERVDSLAVRDERWDVLKRQGYMEEGLAEIARFAAHRGIQDPIAAAAALEREMGYPEPVMSSGDHRSFRALDRAAETENDKAFQALMNGDDERFLEMTIPAYRRSSW